MKSQPRFQPTPQGALTLGRPLELSQGGSELPLLYPNVDLSLDAGYLGKQSELGQGKLSSAKGSSPNSWRNKSFSPEGVRVIHQSIYFFSLLPHPHHPIKGETCPGGLPSLHLSHLSSSLLPPCH